VSYNSSHWQNDGYKHGQDIQLVSARRGSAKKKQDASNFYSAKRDIWRVKFSY
jgi:hypothetical protein